MESGGGPARIGVSSCLLGQNTRHDGGNRLDTAVMEFIKTIAESMPVCPEMEIGMGSPRPPIQLVELEDGVKARGVDNPSLDVTEALERVGGRQSGLSGFILKSRSPSCGVASSNIFSSGGSLISSSGYGVFARAVTLRFPLMPVIEETALRDASSRNAFILRVFVYDLAMRLIRRGSRDAGEFAEKTLFIAEAIGVAKARGLPSMKERVKIIDDAAFIQNYTAPLLRALAGPFPANVLATAADQAVEALSRYKSGTAGQEIL